MTDAPAARGVLVTGAGSGLGTAIAATAREAGWAVGVLDRDRAAAEQVASRLGPGATPLAADVTDEAALEAALDDFERAAGATPDAVVCNAGVVRFGPLLDLDEADWRDVVDVNLTGAFLSARAVARRLAAAGRPGSVVTVTSINGVAPGPASGAYSATKAGIARLTQQMALEWGPLGIRANSVAPGLIDAGMSAPIYADADIRERRAGAVPLRRLGTAEEVAAVVAFLLSDDAAYVTGTEVLVDGGVAHSVIGTLPRPLSVDGVGAGPEERR